MRFQNLLLTALLLLLSAAALPAQNTLPNAHNDACWSSLSALRACQLKMEQQAQEYAQDCTSYPEYQCFDYYQPHQKPAKTVAKADTNRAQRTAAASTEATSSSNVQAHSGTTN